MYINGTWIEAEGGQVFSSYNPATGDFIDSVPDGGARDASKAIDAASVAFGPWSSLNVYQRSEFLCRAHSIMMDRLETLAETMTMEQGKPLRAARNEVKYGADFLLWYGEEVKRLYGQTIPSARDDQRFIVTHQPIGVVGAITPWNYPISMITRKLAPALAAGCTVVLKPAEATPLCARAVFEVFHEAAFPPGVVNLVTAHDPTPIGKIFLEDRRVRKITFTGSTAVGRYFATGAGAQIKRLSLELGGHAPFIVCPDADPVHAAKGLVLVKFLNSGQACISPNRIFVHETIADLFLEELSKRVAILKAGSGIDPNIKIGPLVNEAELEKMDRQVGDAVDHGAELLVGGFRLTDNDLDKGFFYAPTVLSGINERMQIYRQETFGPIAPVITYGDNDDVLAMANDTSYGLAAYVYTTELKTALRMFEGLHFGIIGINDINPTAASAPFGGMKESGIGREGATTGMHEYLEMKCGGFSI